MKIFIVDDDDDVVFIFKTYLESKGHEIIAVASDGAEAIEKYKNFQEPPDVILMDYRMPNVNGIFATKEILKINPDCKIIFLSADYSIMKKVYELGAIDFLEKPIKFGHLLKVLDRINA